MADLRDFTSFEGILKSNGHQWKMPFRAPIGDDGEIEFDILPIPLTRETLEIERLWFATRGRFHLFQVTGDAPDGTHFESATLFFRALTSHIAGAKSRLEVKARCQVGKFVQPIEKPNEKLSVRQALRGFECFEAAVASFFNTPIVVKKLYFAIEWFAMQTVYSETRLLNAMTALENLTNANLDANDLYLLPDVAFDKLCRTMRKALPAPSNLLEKEFRADLPGKLAGAKPACAPQENPNSRRSLGC